MFATATKKVLWAASNCHSLNNREAKISELEAEGMLDSDGACLHNHEATSKGGRGGIDKVKEMHQYLFYAAFENQNVPDYVTEKLFDAFQAGTVPVVYGAPNMPELVPKEWYIWANDYSSTKELAEYLRKVSLNETLYMQYQNARTNVSAWPKWFVQKWSFTHNAECRLRRFVAAHREPDKYVFDPATQELRKREAQPRSHQDHTTREEARTQTTNHKREPHPLEAQGIRNPILDVTGNHTLLAETPQQAAASLRLYGVILVVLGLLAVLLAHTCLRRKKDDYTTVESNVEIRDVSVFETSRESGFGLDQIDG